jgi:hypothetical protein
MVERSSRGASPMPFLFRCFSFASAENGQFLDLQREASFLYPGKLFPMRHGAVTLTPPYAGRRYAAPMSLGL